MHQAGGERQEDQRLQQDVGQLQPAAEDVEGQVEPVQAGRAAQVLPEGAGGGGPAGQQHHQGAAEEVEQDQQQGENNKKY